MCEASYHCHFIKIYRNIYDVLYFEAEKHNKNGKFQKCEPLHFMLEFLTNMPIYFLRQESQGSFLFQVCRLIYLQIKLHRFLRASIIEEYFTSYIHQQSKSIWYICVLLYLSSNYRKVFKDANSFIQFIILESEFITLGLKQ